MQLTLVQRKRRAAALARRRPRPRARRRAARRVRRAAAVRRSPTASARSARRSPPTWPRAHPMHRLLQGEVGSGKTRRARCGRCCRWSTPAGRRRCSRPTEVLAAQHARASRDLLGPLGRAGELDGAPSRPPGSRCSPARWARRPGGRRCAEVAGGAAGIVVGTHALLYEGVDFADLGLVVVDEQHRFGVEQRDALRAKAEQPPHVLVMTATPIPRTVAMTVYGDLEISTLRRAARAAARRSPRTWCRPRRSRPSWTGPGSGCARRSRPGHQAYVVCPRIGDGADGADEDADGAPDDDERRRAPARRWRCSTSRRCCADGPLAGLRLGVLHGRLPADEKDAVMRALRRRRARRAGRDDGDRGRRRRAQRHRDGRPGRRPVRRLAAAPAARPGRPGLARPGCACWSPRRAAGIAGPGAAGRGRVHTGRLRAGRARPGAAPGGRRARRGAVRAPLAPAAAVAAARRAS